MLLKQSVPLVLDLDGTLLRTDTFHEMMAQALIKKPWVLFFLPFWLWKSRAYAKAQLAAHITLSPFHLPYNPAILNFAKEEAQKGRPLILATGTLQSVAQAIADHLGIFQEVIGSNEKINMTGPYKCQALVAKFGINGFDYAGDSLIDAYVWKSSSKALVVHPKRGVLKQAHALKLSSDVQYFPREKKRHWALVHAVRPLFWSVNLIAPSWPLFVAWSLLTSGLFIGGDLINLSHERKMGRKSSMFAQGHLHLITAFLLSTCLITFAFILFAFNAPWIALIALLYSSFFMGLDSFTRPLHPFWRWMILALGQLLLLRGLGA